MERYGIGGQLKAVVSFLWPGKPIGKVIYILTGGDSSARGPSQLFFSCTTRLSSVLGKWTVRAWRRSLKFFWRLPFTGKAMGKDNTPIREWSKQFTSFIYKVSTNSKVFYPSSISFHKTWEKWRGTDRGGGGGQLKPLLAFFDQKTYRKDNLHISGW
jgi:hypothetical protein